MSLVISTIADDERILDIFRYRYWVVLQGIDYLVGIYKYEKTDEFEYLTTLDGRIFKAPEDSQEIVELLDRHDRITELWEGDGKDRPRYFRQTFLRWGIKHREVVKLSWLDDALRKGLVPQTIFDEKPIQEPALSNQERKSLLKMVAGLMSARFRENLRAYGTIKQLRNILETEGVPLSENTVSKYYNEALEELPARKKPQ